MRKVSYWVFLLSALVSLGCSFAIYYLESIGAPSKSPFPLIRILGCLLCFPSSAVFLWLSRHEGWNVGRIFAFFACVASFSWVCYVVYVLVMMAQTGA
jgi:hypothetical protein